MKIKHTEKAFTLIELLVTIAIIAVLMSIILAKLDQARSSARDTKRVGDITKIQTALNEFHSRCNAYPTAGSGDGLPSVGDSAGNYCPSGVTLATFISQMPTPPSQNEHYYYSTNQATVNPPSDYILMTTLENNSSVLVGAPSASPAYDNSPALLTCSHSPAYHYCVQPY